MQFEFAVLDNKLKVCRHSKTSDSIFGRGEKKREPLGSHNKNTELETRLASFFLPVIYVIQLPNWQLTQVTEILGDIIIFFHCTACTGI